MTWPQSIRKQGGHRTEPPMRCCPVCLRPMRLAGGVYRCDKHGPPSKP